MVSNLIFIRPHTLDWWGGIATGFLFYFYFLISSILFRKTEASCLIKEKKKGEHMFNATHFISCNHHWKTLQARQPIIHSRSVYRSWQAEEPDSTQCNSLYALKKTCIMLALISLDHLSRSFLFVGKGTSPKFWLRRELLNDVTLWRKHVLHLKVKTFLACIGESRGGLSFLLRAALLTCLKTAELLVLMFKWGCQKGINRAADKVHRQDCVPLPSPQSSQAEQGEHWVALLDDLTFRTICCHSC